MALSAAGRAGAGAVLAVVVAGAARLSGSLTRSGFIAAVVLGAVTAAAGWRWAVLLIMYFVASTLVSRHGRVRKAALTLGIVAKGGGRDAAQVVANGGVYGAAAIASLVMTHAGLAQESLAWGAVGSIAASAADTWATELGVLFGGTPVLIGTRTAVRHGTSGAVTWGGTLGALMGAAFVGIVATMTGFSAGAGLASVASGFAGSVADSLLGATVQERRWCKRCEEPTEMPVHSCGESTTHIGGRSGVGNDTVNALATLTGFIMSVTLCLLVLGLREAR